jgi:ERCC4-type nuclease
VTRTPDITPIVDTREQRPLELPGAVRGTLPTGDYSCCLEHLGTVAIERKSAADLFACVGRERDRFERELARLALLRFRALVIEADLADLLRTPPERSHVHPSAVLGSLAAWSWRYSLPVWLASDRANAARLVLRLLALAHKDLMAPPPAVAFSTPRDFSALSDQRGYPDTGPRREPGRKPPGNEIRR